MHVCAYLGPEGGVAQADHQGLLLKVDGRLDQHSAGAVFSVGWGKCWLLGLVGMEHRVGCIKAAPPQKQK